MSAMMNPKFFTEHFCNDFDDMFVIERGAALGGYLLLRLSECSVLLGWAVS